MAAGALAAAVPRRRTTALTADDAVQHLDLLVALAADVPVLPLPLGTTAPDDDAVREEVLTPAADQLERQLAAVADLVEVRVDLAFDADAVVADVARTRPGHRTSRRAEPPAGERVSPSGWPSARPWQPGSRTSRTSLVGGVDRGADRRGRAVRRPAADEEVRRTAFCLRRDRLAEADAASARQRGRGRRACGRASTWGHCPSTASWMTYRGLRSPRPALAGGGDAPEPSARGPTRNGDD